MSAEVNEQMTLAEAKRLMRPLARRGVRCFCCNQLVKVYRRKLAAAGCVVLIRVYRRHGRDPVHVASFLGEEGLSTSHYGDTIRLALFGLIEEVRDAPDEVFQVLRNAEVAIAKQKGVYY